MKKRCFKYAFPHSTLTLALCFGPPLAFMILVLKNAGWTLSNPRLDQNTLAELAILSLFITISGSLGILSVNSAPGIALRGNGIEFKFTFLPFLARTKFYRWEQIDYVATTRSRVKPLYMPTKTDLMVVSQHFPVYYYLPMLILKGKFARGFLIYSNIRNYDQLWKILEAHCHFER